MTGPDEQSQRPRVMVVDDESVIADTVTMILRTVGYRVTTEYCAEDALDTALTTPPDLLLTDVLLPAMNGVDLAIRMKRIFPDCKIILFSGQAATRDLMASAREKGHHFDLLLKPVAPKELIHLVNKAFGPADC